MVLFKPLSSAEGRGSRITVARTGDDLVMSVIGEGQTVTVTDWYAASANHAARVTAGDGYTIGDAAIEQLVQAMASLTPPASGQTTLPPELAANLSSSYGQGKCWPCWRVVIECIAKWSPCGAKESNKVSSPVITRIILF
jgi:hypothetical protein